jgi:hypothetical protein
MGTLQNDGGMQFSPTAHEDQKHTGRMDQLVQFRFKFNTNNPDDTYGEVLALESYAQEVVQFQGTLAESKSLTLELALEADRLFDCTDYSKMYFEPGAKSKKYNVAMENVNVGMVALIVAAAAAIAALITKIIHDISGSGSGGNGGGGGLSLKVVQTQKVAAEQLKSIQLSGEALKAANDALHDTRPAANDPHHGHHDLRPAMLSHNVALERQSVDSFHQHYAKALTPFQMDIISTGEYTDLMAELLKEVDHQHPVGVLQDARAAYRGMLETMHDGGNEQEAKRSKYIEMVAGPKRVHRELMAMLKKLSDKHARLDQGHVEFPHDLNTALKLFTAAATRHEIVGYAQDREDLLPVLEHMRTDANEAKEKLKDAKALPQTAQEVMREIHGLLAVVLKVDMLFVRFWKSLSECTRYLEVVVTSAKLKLKEDLKNDNHTGGDAEASSSMQQMDRVLAALGNFRGKKLV